MRTLDIDECAEFLKINRVTASEMAAAGELPGAKIGRAWVFIEDDLVEYLRLRVRQQQRERQSSAESPIPTLSTTKVDAVSCFPAIRQKARGRRTPLPVLPDSPHFVGEVAPA